MGNIPHSGKQKVSIVGATTSPKDGGVLNVYDKNASLILSEIVYLLREIKENQ